MPLGVLEQSVGERRVVVVLDPVAAAEAQIRLTPDPNVITRFHRKMVELDF